MKVAIATISALSLSALSLLAMAAPCLADDLSVHDLGPWAFPSVPKTPAFLAGHPTPPRLVPKVGSANYSGFTAGTIRQTVTFSPFAGGGSFTGRYAMTGTSSVAINFSHQTFTSTFGNFATVLLPQGMQGSGIPSIPFTAVTFGGNLSGNSYTGPVTGSTCSGCRPDAAISGTVNGKLFGDTASATAGTWQALVTGSISPAAPSTKAQILAIYSAKKQ